MGIIRNTQSRVSLYCSSKGAIKPIDFAAEVLCELMGLGSSIKRADDAASYPDLVTIVLDIISISKKHDYSKAATLQMIRDLFLKEMDIDRLKSLIAGSMIVSYPDTLDGYIKFNFISEHPPGLRRISGQEEYVPIEITKPKGRPVRNTTAKEDRHAPKLGAEPLLSKDMIALKQHYNTLEKEGKQYLWEWKVNTEQYEKLKELLKSLCLEIQPPKVIRACAPQIALYIAEWYKREYDGYKSTNSLEEIGLDSSKSQMIWESANLRYEYVFRTEDTNIHEWLYSMYLLGGFPIRYTNRSNRFVSMFDALWGENKDTDEISNDQLQDITQRFDGSQVIKNSLVSGSLHKYYRYLREKEDMPIAEEDKSIEPFKTFIKNLQEGRSRFFNNYIRGNWFLYIDPCDNIIDSVFNVSFGRKNDKCYIPAECLEHWNIPHTGEVKDFWIELKASHPSFETDIKESIRFSKTGRGDSPYVGWTRNNYLEIDVPYSKDTNIEVNLIVNGLPYPIHEPFKVEDSHQFFKTRSPYEWCDRTDNHAMTAVIYDPLVLSSDKPQLSGRELKADGDEKEWIWLPLSEEVCLSDNKGEAVRYTPQNHLLSLSFKQIKNTLKYVNFRDITYRQICDGEVIDSQISLLRKDGLSVSFTPFGSTESEKVPLNKCKVFFKQGNDEAYTQWTDENAPRQGIVRLHVAYPERSTSTTATVYYLPSIKPVWRDLSKNRIIFDQCLKDVFVPTESSYIPLEQHAGEPWYNDELGKSYDPQSDTVPFIIGDIDSSYAIINVFRARGGKELFLKGESHPLVRYTDSTEPINIPYVLRKNFRIRTIDEEGVRNVKCGYNLHISPYDSERSDEENGIRYYRFAKHGTDMRGCIQLETNPDQYRFYYWSMEPGEKPIPVSTDFIKEDKILRLDMSLLINNERGLIFQSLKGVSPRHYFEPIYGKNNSRFRYPGYNECFNIASEHGIPFHVFHCFSSIMNAGNPSDVVTLFIKSLLDQKNWHMTDEDHRSLHRFAEELCFDWFLIPRFRWYRNVVGKSDRKGQEVISDLFRSAPYIKHREKEYMERVLNLYWKLPAYSGWNIRKNKSSSYYAIQSIRGLRQRGVRTDWQAIQYNVDYNETIPIIESIKGNNTLFEELYKIFATIE